MIGAVILVILVVIMTVTVVGDVVLCGWRGRLCYNQPLPIGAGIHPVTSMARSTSLSPRQAAISMTRFEEHDLPYKKVVGCSRLLSLVGR